MSLRFENIRPINKRQERLLLTVLQRALLLRRLYISYAETVLNSDSEIPLAISRLPALVSFEVKPFYADTHGIITDILANMSSRLKFLSLHDDVVSPDLEWHYDLPRALSPHLENLQELHLASPNGRGRVIRSSTIQTLRTSLDVEQPRPNELFNDFPNLRNLLISADWLRDDPFKAISQDEYPTLRSSRMSQQTSGNVWDSLDTVRGKVPELYVLGLTCPVRKLEMTKYRPDRRHMALEVLRHTYPRKLTIGIQPMAEESVTSLDEPSLLAALSSNRHQVTHLTIKMTLKEHGPKTQEILNDLLPLLEQCNIEYLRIFIHGPYGRDDNLEESIWINNLIKRSILGLILKQAILNLDLDFVRDTIVRAVVSLRTIAFTVVIRGETLWTIDRSGEYTTTTQVDAVTAREIIQREEA